MATAVMTRIGESVMDQDRKRINISGKRQITIPNKYFEALGFSGEAECILRGNEIIIKPVSEYGGGEFAGEILADLLKQGYAGDELLKKFNATQKKVRPAVEAMLSEASKVARGLAESSSYEDIFGPEA